MSDEATQDTGSQEVATEATEAPVRFVDTLDENLREDLLATGKVTYTKHTAFSHGFSYENNDKYFSELEEHIMDCLSNTVSKPILSRQERVLF